MTSDIAGSASISPATPPPQKVNMHRQRGGSWALRVLAILSIFISCLGLFGLASYSAEKRIKEIGIRKVMGASVQSIVSLLSRHFVRLVLWANLIAWPLAR